MTQIKTLPTRYPELGRLRMGDKETVTNKAGKQVDQMRKSEHWILTSDDEHTVQTAQAMAGIGGTLERWENGEQTFRLYTDTDTLDVLIPPDAFFSAYERWGSGGCQRRCDGLVAMVPEADKDGGGQLVERSCWCVEKGLTPADKDSIDKGACDLSVRLRVVLPDLPGLGVWILTTGSVYAAMELPGQVALLDRLREAGALVPAVLVLQHRTEKKAWEKFTRDFYVPTLRVRDSMRELSAGGPQPLALARESARPSTIGGFPPHVQDAIYATARHKLADHEVDLLVSHFTGGESTSRKDLNLGQAGALVASLEDGTWRSLIEAEGAGKLDAELTAEEQRQGHTAAPGWNVETPLLSDAQRATVYGALTTLANLSAEQKAEAVRLGDEAGIPADHAELTPAHVEALVEIVAKVKGEAPAPDESPPPSPTANNGDGEVWTKEQWSEAAGELGYTVNKVLTEARKFAAEAGIDKPKTVEEISDPTLISRLRGWLQEERVGAA